MGPYKHHYIPYAYNFPLVLHLWPLKMSLRKFPWWHVSQWLYLGFSHDCVSCVYTDPGQGTSSSSPALQSTCSFLRNLVFHTLSFLFSPSSHSWARPFLKHRSQVSVCSCAGHYGLLSPQSPGLASHGVFLVHNLVGLCSRSLSSPGQLLLVIFIKKG